MLAAGVEFAVRGPVRAARLGREWNDFLSPYVQAAAWVKGLDPYSPSVFAAQWPKDLRRPDFLASEVSAGTLVANHGVPSPYPLTTFVLLAPFSLLPWSIARALWMMTNLAAFALSVAALVALAGLSWTEPRAQIFLAMTLALAPFHTGIATENPAVLVVGFCVIAVWAATRKWHNLSGILLAAAVCLKPQVGLCFVFYYLVRRRWSVAAIAGAWTAAIAFIAAARLALRGVPWLSSYLQDSKSIFAAGAVNDFTPQNPVWYHMIDLQVLLWQFLRNASTAKLLAVVFGALLLAIWMWLVVKLPPGSELLELSALAVLSLLPVYHRFYDAALLIFPLCWSLLVAWGEHRRIACFTIACILPFLIPGAALLNQLAETGRIPAAVSSAWWWSGFVMPHEPWALLSLSSVLFIALKVQRGSR